MKKCSIHQKTSSVRGKPRSAHGVVHFGAPVRGIGNLAHGCWAVDGRAADSDKSASYAS